MTLCGTVALAVAVLFLHSLDYRMPVCVRLSVAAATVAVRAVLTGKFVWAHLFASVLGLFTPFHPTQLSNVRTSILDMATMALFAGSARIFGKSAGPLVLKPARGKL
jgi:hypothetical protein